jgi:hypothetical protein
LNDDETLGIYKRENLKSRIFCINISELNRDLLRDGLKLSQAVFALPFNSQLVPMATTGGARIVDLYSDIVTDVIDRMSPLSLNQSPAGGVPNSTI